MKSNKKKTKSKLLNKTISFHPLVEKKHIPILKKVFKSLGIFDIKDDCYNLIKMKAKNPSKLGYPDKFTVMTGYCKIVGTITNKGPFIWLSMENNLEAIWFKTSPIIKIKKLKNGYKIETMNSIYNLIAIDLNVTNS